MSPTRDYYQVLGVERNADEAEIKKAFWNLARKYHPDVNPGDADAESKFKEINEAYQVLSDPEKRARYDAYGSEAGPEQGGWTTDFGGFDPFSTIFETFFGGGGFGQESPAAGPIRGHDLKYTVAVELAEAAAGVSRSISYSRMGTCQECSGYGTAPGTSRVTCPACGGRGKVQSVSSTPFGTFTRVTQCARCGGQGRVIEKPCPACGGEGRREEHASVQVEIPAGVDTGVRLRVRGEGDAGLRGGSPGDLYVDVVVKPHRLYVRDGNDLRAKVSVSFAQAALGTELELEALDGSSVRLRLRPGVQNGDEVRVKGKGMPAFRGYGRGDIIAEVSVSTPRSLSARERELYEELLAIETGQPPRSAARGSGAGAGAGTAGAGRGKGKDKKGKNSRRGLFGLFGQDNDAAGADRTHDEMG